MKNLYTEIIFKKDNIEIISIKEYDIVRLKDILYAIINVSSNNLKVQTVDLDNVKLYNTKVIISNYTGNELSINIHMKSNIDNSIINDYIEIPLQNINMNDILNKICIVKDNNEEVSIAIESYSNTGIYINRKEVKENVNY